MSAITVGELRRGAALLDPGKRRRKLEVWLEVELISGLLRRILPVTVEVADRWGWLTADCKLRGTPLGMADGLIAATALEHKLVVATRNVRDFEVTGAPFAQSLGFVSITEEAVHHKDLPVGQLAELQPDLSSYHLAHSRDRVGGNRLRTPQHFNLYRWRSNDLLEVVAFCTTAAISRSICSRLPQGALASLV